MHLSATLINKPKASFDPFKEYPEAWEKQRLKVLAHAKASGRGAEYPSYFVAAESIFGVRRAYYCWIVECGNHWELYISDEVAPFWPLCGSAKVLRLTQDQQQTEESASWRERSLVYVQEKKDFTGVIVGREYILRRPMVADGETGEVRIDAVRACGSQNYQVIAGSSDEGGRIFCPDLAAYNPIDTVNVELQDHGVSPTPGCVKIGCAWVERRKDRNVVLGREFNAAERGKNIAASVSHFSFDQLSLERPFFL